MRGVRSGVLLILVLGAALERCGSNEASNDGDGGGSVDGGVTWDVSLHGAVQKGPFLVGSTVVISVLDVELNALGQVFTTETTNDLGEFDITFAVAGPVALEATGYYYDELAGRLSASVLSLRALYAPAASGPQQAHVNLVTHLTTERVKSLVGAGLAFAAAQAQAEAELLSQLAITPAGFAPAGRGIDMTVTGGDTDDNAYLMAVSAVLLQVVSDRTAGSSSSAEAELQTLLNRTALDFADGVLEDALREEIYIALFYLPVERVRQNLARRLAELGSTGATPDVSRVIDQDRDGLANADDECPLLANPGPFDGVCYEPCAADMDCTEHGGMCFGVAAPDGSAAVRLCGATCAPYVGEECADGLECIALLEGWGCIPQGLQLSRRAEGEPCGRDGCGPDLECTAVGTAGLGLCRRPCTLTGPDMCGGRECVPNLGPYCLLERRDHESCGNADLRCLEGLSCVVHDECSPAELCCMPAGGAGQPCREDSSCDAGFTCAFEGFCPGGLGKGCCW
jgi:hypothetical protein